MCAMIMLLVNWTRRFVLSSLCCIKSHHFRHFQVEGILQEMRELSICGGN
jgi:hypothetical protein